MKLDSVLRRQIKGEAKVCIFSRLPHCVLAAAVYLVPAMFVTAMTAVSLDTGLEQMLGMLGINLACEILVLGPIMLGTQQFFVKIARGETPPVPTLFAPLSSLREIFRGIRMMLCLVVRMFLLALAPTALYEAAAYFLFRWMGGQGLLTPDMLLGAVGLLVLLYCVLLLPAIGRMASYWMGYAILHDDPSIGVWRATREGAKLLRGQRMQMMAFALSFLPWFLGGIFTCGVLSGFGMLYLCVSLYRLCDRLQGREAPQQPPENGIG